MSMTLLDGKTLKSMLIQGTENMRTNSEEINALNVFPVPDGDTGTNMTKTLEGGIVELSDSPSETISGIIDKFAHGMLLGARGNSGVILSQIFAGIKEALSKYDSVNAIDLSRAYESGIKKSYGAVTNPTEGTILTVFRESTEYAAKNINEKSTIEDFYKLHIEEAKRSLERTKEILPVLAEADVVDSGGAGYLCIAMGMYSALTGESKAEAYSFNLTEQNTPRIDLDRFTRSSKLEYGYCTEFILRLTEEKVDPDAFDVKEVIAALEELSGESIVAYKEGDIVKAHVHTFSPGEILTSCQRFGEFLTVKIENMSLSHTDEKKPEPKKKKKYAVVAVANGEGISSLFTDIGADVIISGGQTRNPSTEEFLKAFEQCYAESIIVLPNNKNITLVARQAAEMWEEGKVYIVPTATLMEGYGALSVINPAITDMEQLVESASRAAKGVVGSEITQAIRDVNISGKEIKTGDYISITNGEISSVAASRNEALLLMLDTLDMDDYEIITLFVGKSVDDESRVEITELLEQSYPDCEVVVYKGGQEVYDYLIAVE